MPVIKWKQFKNQMRPFGGLEQLFDEKENWIPFVPTLRMEEPAVDIYQDKNNLYVEMPIIGLKPENIEISIEENILTVQGKSEEKEEIKEKDYLRREIKKGAFRRVIKLPAEVKGDKASAETAGGLLKITIPKIAKAIGQTKKIPVKAK